MGLSIRAYARSKGVSHTAVRKAIAAGRIVPLADGKIDPEAADVQLAQTTDPSKRRTRGLAPAEGETPAPTAETMPLGGSPGRPRAKPASDYSKARAQREKAEASLRELRLRNLTGELVPVAQVRTAFYNAARHARNRFLALPAPLASKLAASSSAEECRELLRTEIERILEQMAAEPFFHES